MKKNLTQTISIILSIILIICMYLTLLGMFTKPKYKAFAEEPVSASETPPPTTRPGGANILKPINIPFAYFNNTKKEIGEYSFTSTFQANSNPCILTFNQVNYTRTLVIDKILNPPIANIFFRLYTLNFITYEDCSFASGGILTIPANIDLSLFIINGLNISTFTNSSFRLAMYEGTLTSATIPGYEPYIPVTETNLTDTLDDKSLYFPYDKTNLHNLTLTPIKSYSKTFKDGEKDIAVYYKEITHFNMPNLKLMQNSYLVDGIIKYISYELVFSSWFFNSPNEEDYTMFYHTRKSTFPTLLTFFTYDYETNDQTSNNLSFPFNYSANGQSAIGERVNKLNANNLIEYINDMTFYYKRVNYQYLSGSLKVKINNFPLLSTSQNNSYNERKKGYYFDEQKLNSEELPTGVVDNIKINISETKPMQMVLTVPEFDKDETYRAQLTSTESSLLSKPFNIVLIYKDSSNKLAYQRTSYTVTVKSFTRLKKYVIERALPNPGGGDGAIQNDVGKLLDFSTNLDPIPTFVGYQYSITFNNLSKDINCYFPDIANYEYVGFGLDSQFYEFDWRTNITQASKDEILNHVISLKNTPSIVASKPFYDNSNILFNVNLSDYIKHTRKEVLNVSDLGELVQFQEVEKEVVREIIKEVEVIKEVIKHENLQLDNLLMSAFGSVKEWFNVFFDINFLGISLLQLIGAVLTVFLVVLILKIIRG